jgi:2-oxoglutarate dehydrogenase E2 component (dihydrolipoamide succinyltransferase)
VRADEPVLELETDKATMEIAASASGRLEIVAREGAHVRVGEVVARIAEGEAGSAPAERGAGATAAEPERAAPAERGEAPRAGAAPAAGPAASAAATRTATPPPAAPAPAPARDGVEDGAPLSPAVRKLVAERGLDPADIAGTGKGGRLTKEDVLRHGEPAAPASAPVRDGAAPAETPEPRPAPSAPESPPSTADADERVPMSGLRRRIAERLVEVQRTAAILTTFNEVDCSALLAARKRHRERFRARHGVDLGLMSLFARATVQALQEVRVVNASLDGGDIVYHHHVHLGIAVSTSRGLVVPVIRRAEALSLADLERAVGALAARARDGKLVPDDLAGGTFTITNGGVFGSLLSTPILNPPQSGILGMHKIEERPIAVEGQVVIRPMMYVALSYDHRLVDGEQAVTFLVRVKERLEDPVRMLLEV